MPFGPILLINIFVGEGIVMVNLKAKPFNLTDEAIKWVEDTIAGMTIEEKIGQLFVNMVLAVMKNT